MDSQLQRQKVHRAPSQRASRRCAAPAWCRSGKAGAWHSRRRTN